MPPLCFKNGKDESMKSNSYKLKNRTVQASYHLMLLPGMLFVLVFNYIPMFGIIMAFQDYVPAKGILRSEWVGLKHFIDLFNNSDIWEILRNTVTISLGKILLRTLMALVFAILLNEIRAMRLKKCVQTIVYLPHFLSWVILASVFTNMFGLTGSVNTFLGNFGIERINFLGSNKLFQPFVIATDVWKEFGYASIMYLAAITAIDPMLHEAAAMDGASWLQRIWHITLPGMLPIIVLVIATDLAGILNAGFDQIYNLYSVGVYETGDILDTYVYRVGMIDLQYSFSTAVGLIKSVVGMILMISVNKFSKKFANRSVF